MIDDKFKSDVRFGYLTQAAVALNGFFFMFIVTRYGSVATYGALMLLVSMSSVMGNFLSFRTNEAIVAFYKRGETTGDMGQCKFALVAGVFLDLLVGLALLAILTVSSEPIARLLLKDSHAASEVTLFGFVMLLTVFKSSPLAFLQASERIRWANAITLAENVAKLALVCLIVLATNGLSLRHVIWAVLASSVGALLLAYLPLSTALLTRLRRVRIARDGKLLGEYLRFSLKTFASSTLKAGNQNIDTLVLGYLTAPNVVGIYSTFRQFLSPLTFLSGPFEAVAYPRFVKAITQQRPDELQQAISGINRKLLMAFGMAILLILPATTAYSVVNDLHLDTPSYCAFMVMALTAFLRGQLWWARPFSNAVDPGFSLSANFLACVFLLLALYPMTWAFNLLGTALSMLALSIILVAFWSRTLARHV